MPAKGNSQIDKDTLGNLADSDFNNHAFEPEPFRQYSDKDIGIYRIEEHLEYGIEGNQTCSILRVAAGEVIPYNYHGNTTGKSYHDKADHVCRIAVEENNRQKEHENRSDYPVLDK